MNVAAPPAYAEQKAYVEGSNSQQSDQLNLTIDGQLIYPTTPPATALYQISSTLNMTGTSISISRVGSQKPRKPSSNDNAPSELPDFDSDKTIYDIHRIPLKLGKLELIGKRRSTLPGSIRMERGLLDWKMWHEQKGSKTLLFRAMPDTVTKNGLGLRWKDAGGQILAVDRYDSVGDGPNRCVMAFEKRLEPAVQDVLVACWCAKVWAEAMHPLYNGNSVKETRKFHTSILQDQLARMGLIVEFESSVRRRLRLGKEANLGKA